MCTLSKCIEADDMLQMRETRCHLHVLYFDDADARVGVEIYANRQDVGSVHGEELLHTSFLGVKHLLCKLRCGQRAVLLRSTRCEGRKAHHEEVRPWERDEIHCHCRRSQFN